MSTEQILSVERPTPSRDAASAGAAAPSRASSVAAAATAAEPSRTAMAGVAPPRFTAPGAAFGARSGDYASSRADADAGSRRPANRRPAPLPSVRAAAGSGRVMSLIRQVWALLVAALTVAFVGGFAINVYTARHYLETQLRVTDQGGAQSLALALQPFVADAGAMTAAIGRQFESGRYEAIRVVSADGRLLAGRTASVLSGASSAPGWFVRLFGVGATAATAPLAAAGGAPARVEVVGAAGFANDQLWSSTLASTAMFTLLVGLTGLFAFVGVSRIRRPLDSTVQQAQAITERRFVEVSEPSVPELRNLTRAMNTMVVRLRTMFDEQAAQVEHLRRQAHCDPLTGLAHRQHFMARLGVALSSEDGGAGGALVFVRLVDLQALNRRIGHAEANALIVRAAVAMRESAERHGSSEVGRLNGSDFAVLLNDVESLREPAVDAVAQLRSLLAGHEGVSYAVAGAVRWWHGVAASSLLAAADQALARAEGRGAYSVEIDDTGNGLVLGEDAWRARIVDALAKRAVQLVAYRMVDRAGETAHLECPLRLGIGPEGELMPAVEWLPMARRGQLTADTDSMAIELALKAIADDGVPRSVHVSPASLLDTAFVPRLRGLLGEHPGSAPGLLLEVAESGAMRHIELMRELAAQAHAFGVRVGLEHGGEGLGSNADGLLEAGLDFAKLDASLVSGVGADAVRATHVGGIARMLHGIGFKVYAEGVVDAEDAVALWTCGIDGITGPIVRG